MQSRNNVSTFPKIPCRKTLLKRCLFLAFAFRLDRGLKIPGSPGVAETSQKLCMGYEKALGLEMVVREPRWPSDAYGQLMSQGACARTGEARARDRASQYAEEAN